MFDWKAYEVERYAEHAISDVVSHFDFNVDIPMINRFNKGIKRNYLIWFVIQDCLKVVIYLKRQNRINHII